MSIPETSSSSDQNTETGPSSTTTTISLTGLPPNTVKADIRPVFQPFGEITRIFVQPDGRCADVVFADVHGVKSTLHAYAEKPLHVRGREIIVFRKYTKMNKVSDLDADADPPSRVTWTEQGCDDTTIFVSDFPPTMMQEELLEALEPFGKYEKFVMCMSFAFLSLSLSLSSKWAF
jgi:RNA recognition motif-containing protein